MPPKPKFSKEEIIQCALEIVTQNGIDALTARSLGEKLGSSARPIFTVFKSMEEVQSEVIASAESLYDSYVEEGLKQDIAFKGVGEAYIRFAIEQPKLFQLLFMREQEKVYKVNEVLGAIDHNKNKILQSIEEGYHLPKDIAMKLYLHLWIYSHGIAVLLATNVCNFSGQEISGMLTVAFTGVLKKILSEVNQ